MKDITIIQASAVTQAVRELYGRINSELRPDVLGALERALEIEDSPIACDILTALIENEQVSRQTRVPLCQDTGLAVAFVEMGNRVVLQGGTLQQAVDDGVRAAVRECYLRASTVADPLERRNVGDNTPAIVHLRQVEGDALTIDLMAKGGGAENMSRVWMLSPGHGRDGVVEAVVETVRLAGANPCPPVIVGVGLGGNFETAPRLAKHALFRELGSPNPDHDLDELEREILQAVNDLGIGPQGFGGRTTALAVLIESAPCHIASLPLAVNVECHSHRHGRAVLRGGPAPA